MDRHRWPAPAIDLTTHHQGPGSSSSRRRELGGRKSVVAKEGKVARVDKSVEEGSAAAQSAASPRLLVASEQPGSILALTDQQAGQASSAQIPGVLALAAFKDTLFATSTANGGEVVTFRMTDDGLDLLSRISSGGVEPCHLAVDPRGSFLLITNYSSSTLMVRRLVDGVPGEITDLVEIPGAGPVAGRQESSHFHQAVRHPAENVWVVCDLGADELHGFRLDPTSGVMLRLPLWSARTTPGAGPRHAAFHLAGLLVSDELSSTVSWYAGADDGQLTWIRSIPSTLGTPEGNYPSEIVLSEDGRFAYIANRGRDTIGIVLVSNDELTLTGEVPAGGRWPRHLLLRGDRLYCALQDSDAVTTFSVDCQSGALVQLPGSIPVPRPTWLIERPDGPSGLSRPLADPA